jgi:hypothetical protein
MTEETELARLITGILGVIMMLGVTTFIVLYWRLTRWHETALGRHMLYFMLALEAVLIVRTCRYFWEDVSVFIYLGLVTFTVFAGEIWHRVYLLVRSLRRES